MRISKRKSLASVLAFREGKKSQVKIGDIREILARLFDLLAESNMRGNTYYYDYCSDQIDKRISTGGICEQRSKIKAKKRQKKVRKG